MKFQGKTEKKLGEEAIDKTGFCVGRGRLMAGLCKTGVGNEKNRCFAIPGKQLRSGCVSSLKVPWRRAFARPQAFGHPALQGLCFARGLFLRGLFAAGGFGRFFAGLAGSDSGCAKRLSRSWHLQRLSDFVRGRAVARRPAPQSQRAFYRRLDGLGSWRRHPLLARYNSRRQKSLKAFP